MPNEDRFDDIDPEMEGREAEAEEIMEVRSESPFAPLHGEVYGPGVTPPSVYYCPVCDKDVLAKHVVWDRDDVAHCPTCDTVVLRKETQA